MSDEVKQALLQLNKAVKSVRLAPEARNLRAERVEKGHFFAFATPGLTALPNPAEEPRADAKGKALSPRIHVQA